MDSNMNMSSNPLIATTILDQNLASKNNIARILDISLILLAAPYIILAFLILATLIPLGATLAVGDQWNDLDMIAEVGHGAAMPSAPAGVRAVARYIAPPLEDDGVASLIEELVLASPDRVRRAAERLARAADERRSRR